MPLSAIRKHIRTHVYANGSRLEHHFVYVCEPYGAKALLWRYAGWCFYVKLLALA